jgi:hypothetical protein
MNTIENIGDDRLHGVREIAKFRGEPERHTRHLIERGLIPHGREGNIIVASKRTLLEHWRQTTSGEKAAVSRGPGAPQAPRDQPRDR